MRKFFCFFLLILMGLTHKMYAQLPGVYFGEFTTEGKNLIVVVDEEDENNKGVKAALEKVMPLEWKLTPFKILTKEEFVKEADAYKEDSKNIFMSFNYYGVKARVGAGLIGKVLYNREMLLGNVIKSNGKVVRSNTIAYLMSLPADIDSNLIAGFTKDITVMKKLIAGQKTEKERINPDPIIKEKVLYINRNHIGDKTEEDIKEKYPYPFKIVEPSEYADAILQKKPDIVFFEYVRADDMPSIFIFSMDSASLLLWCQNARGVNQYVHANFQVLANKLK